MVTCEHASGEVPAACALGVPPEVLASHHACDLGAADLARALAGGLGAPLHLGRVSRLVVDLNRAEDSPEVIPTRSFGVEVPGNRGLPPAAREARLLTLHRPFRRAVLADVRRAVAARGVCLHLSVHSFTPVLGGVVRAVEVGVLFDPARPLEVRAADLMLAALRAHGADARSNEPYRGVDDGLTTWLRLRLAPEVYAGLEVEVSQGLPDEARARVLADLLAAVPQVLEALAAGGRGISRPPGGEAG